LKSWSIANFAPALLTTAATKIAHLVTSVATHIAHQFCSPRVQVLLLTGIAPCATPPPTQAVKRLSLHP
jgi:hypothetical protein